MMKRPPAALTPTSASEIMLVPRLASVSMKLLLVALIPTSASEIMLVPRLAWSLIPTSASETQSMHRLLLASALVSTLASETKQAPWTMMRSIPAIPKM
jgi:hypothetical protein